jgi:UDP-N-acetylmuramate--alanine ligase
MHVFFSGIGGAGISALAVIAKQSGYEVSGSDARQSQYLEYLNKKAVDDTYVGLSREQIAAVHAKNPIDWYVYGSAQPLDFPDNPELKFCQENGIKMSKRDEFLSNLLKEKNLKLIAIAGTHGKTTTTAMAIWLFKQVNISLSYSVGGKISFGDMGHYQPGSEYFVYEADEFDRNFLAFEPHIALISGVDWDHPDIYPTREDYNDAFKQFLSQSQQTFLWQDDKDKLGAADSDSLKVLDQNDPRIDQMLKLAGHVNRLDAWLVANSLQEVTNKPLGDLFSVLNAFPGLSRRFEQIAPNLYSDYAHTPPKIRGALQLAQETTGDNVVVIYEGLHNTRQHFIKDELANLFDGVKELYIVPSYLARENKDLELLTPEKLLNMLSNSSREHGHAAGLNDQLKTAIRQHLDSGDLVLAFSAGGGDSLDEWLRQNF